MFTKLTSRHLTEKNDMKIIVTAALLTIGMHSIGQRDTMIVYYKNGQLKTISPKLNGKPHGKSKTWYENGQLWFVSWFENGKQTKTIMFHENGRESYYVRYHKWRTKIKTWHPDGTRWTSSRSKYFRSIEREYDSIGVLVHKTIEKKGSSVSCTVPIDSDPSDSLMYKDGSCMCIWGKAFWRNGVFVDEKGRDLSTNYSYVRLDYYSNGSRQRETVWSNRLKQYVIREWDEKGKLIQPEEPARQ